MPKKIDADMLAGKIIKEFKGKKGGADKLVDLVAGSVKADELRDSLIDKALSDPELSSKIITELMKKL